jgi:hypothetical protein
VSGIADASSTSDTSSTGPLTLSVQTSDGGVSYGVSGNTSNLYAQFGIVINDTVTGGAPPVTVLNTTAKQAGSAGSGVSIVSTAGGPSIKWILSNVGDSVLFTLSGVATDSLGATASASYPGSGSILIQRTS